MIFHKKNSMTVFFNKNYYDEKRGGLLYIAKIFQKNPLTTHFPIQIQNSIDLFSQKTKNLKSGSI